MAYQRQSSTQRGYDRRWRNAREAFLIAHPLCVMCQQQGRASAASVVDHIQPHRGDMVLFWARSNWQALCKHCHDSEKKRHESGKRGGFDATGLPINPAHHWRGYEISGG